MIGKGVDMNGNTFDNGGALSRDDVLAPDMEGSVEKQPNNTDELGLESPNVERLVVGTSAHQNIETSDQNSLGFSSGDNAITIEQSRTTPNYLQTGLTKRLILKQEIKKLEERLDIFRQKIAEKRSELEQCDKNIIRSIKEISGSNYQTATNPGMSWPITPVDVNEKRHAALKKQGELIEQYNVLNGELETLKATESSIETELQKVNNELHKLNDELVESSLATRDANNTISDT